ncbi:MAG: GSU2403 family nucleotidyltransferase fold protein [Pseudomonadota bacterium]
MHATPLSLTARTLYAELRDLALAVGATENMGEMPGTLVRKRVRDVDYLYYQYRDLDGHTRQAYLGADTDTTRGLAGRLERRARDREADLRRLEELRAAYVGAGGGVIEHTPLRVLQAFVDAGVLQPGLGCGVLVGTHAFNVLGNLLGVRWASQMHTQDIDLAGVADIDIAVSRPRQAVPEVLAQLAMGFIPVPTLDPRSPSTSFRVRGQELRVDLLTPLVGKPRAKPVFVPALNAVAQPLRFLDYLLESPVPAVIVGRRALLLANVPAPERFALHKLLVSESRVAAFATKAEKDRQQAMQMLEVLMQEAPDGVAPAVADLRARGKGWADKLGKALHKCARTWPDVAAWVQSLG